MTPNDLITQSLIEHDTVDALETQLGRPLSKDNLAEDLLLVSRAFQDNRAKDAWLKHVGDTTFSMSWLDYYVFVSNLGFKEIAKFPLHNPAIGRDCMDDVYFFFREDGFLLVADTYSYESDGKLVVHRNSAHLCFALKPKNENSWKSLPRASYGWESKSEPDWRRTYEEGKPEDAVMMGDLDAREALGYSLRRMTDNFEPQTEWPRKPGRFMLLKLVVGQDYPSNGYGPTHRDGLSAYIDNVALKRLYQLPAEVQKMLNIED